jgi:hypothetical protein
MAALSQRLVARSLALAPSRLLLAAPQPAAAARSLQRRAFASEPAVADPSKGLVASGSAKNTAVEAGKGSAGGEAGSSSGSTAAHSSAAASTATSSSGSSGGGGSSLWQRFTAFLTGVGVSSVGYYYLVRADVAESGVALDRSIADFRADSAAVAAELRGRVATLEHEVAAIKGAARRQ